MPYTRNQAQVCRQCAAYLFVAADTGECRLTTPQLVAAATPEWPIVSGGTWCQQWVPKSADPGWNEQP